MIETKKYKWKIRSDEVLPKYNLSKYYQHGDILWKLYDKSIETTGKVLNLKKQHKSMTYLNS